MKVVLPVVNPVVQAYPKDVRPGKTIGGFLPVSKFNYLDPKRFPWVNVRNQDPTVHATATSNIITKSLYGDDPIESDPSSFHIKNQGVAILAGDGKILANGHVELSLEAGLHGLFNGGGTTLAILNGDFSTTVAYAPIKILCGDFTDKDFNLTVNLAHNTGTPVDAYSVANHRGWFAWLKSMPNAPKLKYKEGDTGIPVGYLYQLLGLLIFKGKNSGEWMPTKAYTGRNEVLEHFGRNKPLYRKYVALLPELLELHDYIMRGLYDMPGYQNSYFSNNPHARRTLRPFYGEIPADHKPPQALIFPMFASFLSMIADGETPKFRGNPKAVFDRVGSRMVAYVNGVLAQQEYNNNKLGRTQEVYDELYRLVETTALGMKTRR